MKQKIWNRVIACLLAAVLFGGIISGQGMHVYAENGATVQTEAFDSFENAVAYLREQMVLRQNNITLLVRGDAFPNGVKEGQLFGAAMAYSEDCTGQEGDALVFGYKGASMSSSAYSDGYYLLNYTVTYETNAEQEAALTEAVKSAMQSMELDGLLEYEKVKVIHDYICTNVNYDYTFSKYSAYDALCNGESVCQGYAILFYRLCKEAGLSVRIVNGTGNGGDHAWNIVQVGGRYYNVDCTWDGQDDTNYDTYFLKSEADFGNHAREEAYLTGDFMAAYPMAENSWKDYSLMKNGAAKTNYNAAFTALDGSTVTSTANGKPKVLVFYSLNCGNSRQTLMSISGGEFSDVDIIAVEVNQNSNADIEAFRDTYASNNIAYTYCESADRDWNVMWNYVGMIEGEYSVTYPYIAYIDENNLVQYGTMAYSGAGTIRDNITFYCKESVVPTMTVLDKGSMQLEVGETGKITATVSPANATLTTVGYESSDKNVARVDRDGNIVAISQGKTTITAYAVDAFSTTKSTCEVVVTKASIVFEDVITGAYYEIPVQWAVENGITNGYGSDTIFNPEGTCTRGQIVTFLWRANGSPEPTSMNNPFTDVKSSDYYYKAVLWAVENGITAGYGSDTIFNPEGACTRGQVATFLWRAEEKPDMSHATNPFTDVEAGEFYYDAVLWAVENGITNGYGSDTIFNPNGDCTRGQIVTFLYRAMN